MRLASAVAVLACLCLCVAAQGPSTCLNNLLSSSVVSTSLPWCAAYTARYPGGSVYAPSYPLCSNALNSTESSASLSSLARFICALQLFQLPSFCQQAFLKFTCHDKLRPCTMVEPSNAAFAATVPANFGLPPVPCFSTCQTLNTPLGPGQPTCGQLIRRAWAFVGQPDSSFESVVPSNCSSLITNPRCFAKNVTDPITNNTVTIGGGPNIQYIPNAGFAPLTGPQPTFPLDGQSTLYLLPPNASQVLVDPHFVPCNTQASIAVPITCPATVLPTCFTEPEKAVWLSRTLPECTVHLANMTLLKVVFPICSSSSPDGILNETEAIASYNSLSSLFRAFFHLAPKDCVDQGLDFVCNQNFRSCGDLSAYGLPFKLPVSVCRNVCETVNAPISKKGKKPHKTCRAALYDAFLSTQASRFDAAEKAAVEAAAEAGANKKQAKEAAEAALNAALAATFEGIIPSSCNKTEPGCDLTLSCCTPITNSIKGQPQWPDSAAGYVQNWTVSPFAPAIPIRCNPGYIPPRPDMFDFVKCYHPWKSTKNAGLQDRPYCQIPCPVPLWDESVILAGMVLQSVIGTTSYVIALVTAVTMFLQPHLRSYPGSVSLWQMVAIHIVCFGFVFQMLGGFTYIWCKNPFQECGAWQCGACTYLGLHFHWSSLAATVLWWFVAVNTFVSVFLHKAHWFALWTEILTHVLSWGFPAVMAIIALASGNYGYRTLSPFCFINTVSAGGWWSYGLFYIPVGFMLVTAAFCMICVFWEMRKITGAGMGKSRWYKNFRISVFLFVYLYIWTFIFMYRFYLEDYTDKIRGSFQKYAQCSISGPNCKRGFQPSAGIYLVLIINTSATGWACALIFGTTKETVFFWKQRFQNLLQGKSFFAGLTLTTSKAGSMVNNDGHSSRVDTNTSGSSE